MGKISGSEIDGVQGQKEVDGIFSPAKVVAVGIKLGAGHFINRQRSGIGGNAAVINSDPGCPTCNFAAAFADVIKYID